MGFLFLDIESFVSPDNERSGLNPHYEQSKVIVISYNHYNLAKAPTMSQVKPPTFIFIWNTEGEKDLLTRFYKIITKIHETDPMLKMVGFNHMGYDMPYLFSRMSYHKIAAQVDLFDNLYSKVRHIDLSQHSMAVSEKTKRDEDFRCISQKAINYYFDIPVKESNGKDVSEFYRKKRYDLVEKYVTEEFTFEMLYRSLLDYFLYVK